MLVSPKWQKMWLESQHCSKAIISMHLPSQQTQKVLEDLKRSCCSPNKAVQLQALKCWGIWINNQNPDDWKVNSICFTAVRPLISKKLQPLYKDMDICKMKFSLMWALLVKVQNIMHLEGPQYILEIFLQSCLTWLSSANGDGCENEILVLMFQLLLGIFKKGETSSDCDKELFPPLSTDILLSNKIFHHFADKFLNIFIHWRKVRDKNVILRLWRHFLENCEISCEHIPIPVWHKIFKLSGQICSEKDESVKERLNFLHSCATTLKSALSSSKFIDFGNLMTTPCEALFKKLVELCTVESNECCDLEMFMHSKEICQVLSDRSVAVGGFDLCLNVLDVLEEFCLRSLFWGVWCGLVYCYQIQLSTTDKNNFTKIQNKFYRKLRGVAVNFELDRNNLHEDCITEVEKHIDVLKISCLCRVKSKVNITKAEDCQREVETLENQPLNCISPKKIVPDFISGAFLTVSVCKKPKLPTKTVSFKFDLIRNILGNIRVQNSWQTQPFNGFFDFRFINMRVPPPNSGNLLPAVNKMKIKVLGDDLLNFIPPCIKTTPNQLVSPPQVKKNSVVIKEKNDEVISTPKTRSKKRAEEEQMKKEMENQKRKKRRSFEVLVQEIVRKNKERKTEKNCSEARSPVSLRSRKRKKKIDKKPLKKTEQKKVVDKENKNKRGEERKLNSKKERIFEKKEEKKSQKRDGKLENYFKVITKKSGGEIKDDKKPKKKIKTKVEVKKEKRCCRVEKKGEIAWRQTSLKSMMNEKSKAGKVLNLKQEKKQGLRTRNKTPEVTNVKPKGKKANKKVTDSPLAKLSPFKEVFHDHEYAKIEPEELQTFEKVVLNKKNVKKYEKKSVRQNRKSVNKSSEKVEIEKTKIEDEKQSETVLENSLEVETEKVTSQEEEEPDIQEEEKEIENTESIICESINVVKPEETTPVCNPSNLLPVNNENNLKEITSTTQVSNVPDLLHINEDDISQECPDEYKEITSTPTRKAKKRIKMLDSLKPSKKLKLDIDEKLPIEIIEKENLEEKQLDIKKEKNIKNGGSPNAINGMISSRALRMIALVPESTKTSQIQWESPSRVELLKFKKAPNVDKNSRASKMLALLSENVVEVEEINEFNSDDVNCNKGSVSTPNTKTPVSSLKSPNSTKKRRSIRFDDAKNETVLYQTDTPPSQIHEEKEKCRRIKPTEIILNLP